METNGSSPNKRKSKAGTIAQAGALITAILASACCWLPLLFIALGVSGGAVAAQFEAYRPVLLPAAFGLLGLAFYYTYRRPRAGAMETSGDGDACCAVPGGQDKAPCCPEVGGSGLTVGRFNKIMLWVIAALVLAFTLFPYYAGIFINGLG
ncbi:MAG: hypothetical protein HY804_01155 [Nitrospinae bacterium]|nr:hypothetical protein [Nitrospinota bacterium]